MIRKMVSGLALLLVCTLPKAQTSASPAIGGEYVDVGGSKIWYEECGSSASEPAVVLLHDGGSLHYRLGTTSGRRSVPGITFCGMTAGDTAGGASEDSIRSRRQPLHGHAWVVQHAVMVGNSSGGGLAVDFALANPKMVEALFLIGRHRPACRLGLFQRARQTKDQMHAWLMAM